jgi:hypothetical protein
MVALLFPCIVVFQPTRKGVPTMTQVQAIMTPWSPVGDFLLMWLQMLPVTVLVAWLTGRLLGSGGGRC